MKTFELKLQKRTYLGKKATSDLRKNEMVPCEIYSKKGNIHACGHVNDFIKGMHNPDVNLFNIDVDGEKMQAIVQDAQYHPVTDAFLHVDFLAVDNTTPVKINLPVELIGTSVGVQRGGKLKTVQRKLKVRGLIKDFPETIKVDISTLDVGQGIKIANIQIPGVEFIEPKSNIVVKVMPSRSTKE